LPTCRRLRCLPIAEWGTTARRNAEARSRRRHSGMEEGCRCHSSVVCAAPWRGVRCGSDEPAHGNPAADDRTARETRVARDRATPAGGVPATTAAAGLQARPHARGSEPSRAEPSRWVTVGGPARRAHSRTGSKMVAEDAARGRSRLSPLSLARHLAHQTGAPMRSAARALFGRLKSSKIDAHTCPEGGDANKPTTPQSC
jgi:hypothetical protein